MENTNRRQALLVEYPDDSFDPTIEPANGMDYLKQVIFERRSCPKIVVKPIPRKLLSARVQTAPVEEEVKPENLIPTLEWQNIQIESFHKIQAKVSRVRKNPKYEEFILNPSNPLVILDNEDKCSEYCSNNEPLFNTIISLGQRRLELLLEYLSNWLSERSEDEALLSSIVNDSDEFEKNHEWLTKWIYSSLVCLQLPLDAQVHSSLRVIAKACIKIRSSVKNSDDQDSNLKVLPFNLLICIIAKSFDQLDLVD